MLTIRLGDSYWKGTPGQVVRWAKQECYNDLMRRRQQAARNLLMSIGVSPSALV